MTHAWYFTLNWNLTVKKWIHLKYFGNQSCVFNGIEQKKSGRQRTFIGDIQVASGVMFSGDVDHSKSVHAMAEDECDAKQVITGFFYLRMIHFCR